MTWQSMEVVPLLQAHRRVTGTICTALCGGPIVIQILIRPGRIWERPFSSSFTDLTMLRPVGVSKAASKLTTSAISDLLIYKHHMIL